MIEQRILGSGRDKCVYLRVPALDLIARYFLDPVLKSVNHPSPTAMATQMYRQARVSEVEEVMRPSPDTAAGGRAAMKPCLD